MKYVLLGMFLGSLVLRAEDPTALINGRPAEPGAFPASVWTRSCSATVVGPRVVFIAAHCVDGNSRISFSAGANNYTAQCAMSPDYRGNHTADYALCETDREVRGIPYERMNKDPNRLRVGDQVLLTGYGCVRPGGGGGNDGTYRIGESTIRSLPSGNNNDIVTHSGAALCFGDSGGPAFHIDADGDRVVISTNSRGNISTTSYLSATHTSQAQRFFASWVNQKGHKICGLHEDVSGCRGGGGGGGGENRKFAITHPVASVSGEVADGQEHLLLRVRTALERTLDEVDAGE